ncbi:MAG: Immediate-early protein 2 [Aeromicrobium sp.]|nr:Immediate-early protein 2 [Aeromicrobium sp.]
MALIEIIREVGLTPDVAWRRLTDWQAHGPYVPLTSITLTPDGFDAFTGIGRVGFHDPMDVVERHEPSYCRLEKRGRVVKGWAELSVDPLGGGSRVTWREAVRVTGAPRAFDGLTRFASTRLFSRVIDGLLAE